MASILRPVGQRHRRGVLEQELFAALAVRRLSVETEITITQRNVSDLASVRRPRRRIGSSRDLLDVI